MNPHMIKRLFPGASASLLAANASDYGNSTPDPQIPAKEQRQQPEPLAHNPKAEAPSAGRVLGGPGDSRPHVCITLYGTRFFDTDAKYGVIKDVLDCCWRTSLIPGDREDQISLEVRQAKVKTKKEERTEITITRPALLAEIRKGV